DRVVAKEIRPLEKVMQVKMAITPRPLHVLGKEKGAFDQQDSRGEELRRGFEDLGSAVARVREQRSFFATSDLDSPSPKRGKLRSGPAGELVGQLVPTFANEMPDAGNAVPPRQKPDLQIATQLRRLPRTRRQELHLVRDRLEPLGGGDPAAHILDRL